VLNKLGALMISPVVPAIVTKSRPGIDARRAIYLGRVVVASLPKGQIGEDATTLSQVDEVVDLYPDQCESCWESLPQVADPYPKRDQHTELPPVKPHTKEFRRHKVRCACCGHRTRARKDDRIPKTAFGPRLTALMGLLTGVYHLSRRKTRELLSDVVGVQVSLGALSAVEARVSDAVAPAVDEAWKRVGQAKVKHTDGTSWYQAGVALSLWTIATVAVTVFKIVQRGNLFAERLMTIAHTARKQNKNVLAFLTACCQAAPRNQPPSLFGAEAA
jgi:hypothetical protein